MNKRQRLVALSGWLVENKSFIGYPGLQPNGSSVPFRPMPWIGLTEAQMLSRFKLGVIWYPDCSAFVTWCFEQAGLKDPNGLGFNGDGNSQIMWQKLKHYTNPAHAQAGALVTYGAMGEVHVCFVVTPGSNPILCSHGSAAGPILVDLESESAAHAGQAMTLLDVTTLA